MRTTRRSPPRWTGSSRATTRHPEHHGAEWDWDNEEFNLKPKGMRHLALEGHWFLDGLDEDGRHHVQHQVPPVRRFILIKLVGGAERAWV